MKAEELIPEGLRLEGFHTAHYDFSFEELCAVLPDDFAARLKTFIHAKYELFLKGAEGDEKAWCMGKLNKDTYTTIMRGERPEDLYSFHSFWSMPDIKWHLRFMMDMTREMKLVRTFYIDASTARWLPDGINAMIEEADRKKQEEHEREVSARKPLHTVLEVLTALKDLDPNLPVYIGSTYDCGYGWAGGNIQNYTVSESGVSFMHYDE